MKMSLIALVSCCAVTTSAFASIGALDATEPRHTVADLPGVHPPRLNDLPGVHPPRLNDLPGVHPPRLNDLAGVHPPRLNDQARQPTGVRPTRAQ